jgi:hypothetical protein
VTNTAPMCAQSRVAVWRGRREAGGRSRRCVPPQLRIRRRSVRPWLVISTSAFKVGRAKHSMRAQL